MNSQVATRAPRASVLLFVRAHSWPLVVWAAMVSWTTVLFADVRSDFHGFRLARYDLGNMTQAVWSTAHGRPLEVTDATGEQVVRLAGHVDPILVLFVPLWTVLPTPLTLAAVQIVACALGALPVFWLGRRHLGSEKAAGLFALAYLAYPWLAWTALDAMHPVTLAIPLFLYAAWFLDSGRLVPFAICAALILATGELMGLPLAGLGLWYWHTHGRRRAGISIAAAGVAWTAVCLKLIIPAFRGEASPFYDRFASVGGSPEGLLRTVFTDPAAIISATTSIDDLTYVLWLAVPLAGLFLLSPLALVALPVLTVNALSDWPTTTDPRHHYVAGVVPFLVAGSVLAAKRVRAERRPAAGVAVLALSLAFSFLLGPWPGAPGTRPESLTASYPQSHVEALRAALEIVPAGAPVSATNSAGSHLAGRRYAYAVPVVRDAEWIVLDSWNTWMPAIPGREEGLHPEILRSFLDRVAASPRWVQVFERDGVLVFQRTAVP